MNFRECIRCVFSREMLFENFIPASFHAKEKEKKNAKNTKCAISLNSLNIFDRDPPWGCA